MDINLPKEKTVSNNGNPKTFLLYAIPKAGKTTIVSQLEDTLIIELEPNGADYVDALKFDINTGDSTQNLIMLRALGDKLKAERPYKRIVIDTLTKIDEWSELAGTYRYMQSPQGKKFNAGLNGPTDSAWQSVHDLPEGYGYRHSRSWIMDLYDDMLTWADEIIFICHVKDKFIASKTGDAVQSIDINLTGKLSKIIPSRVDAIGYFHRKGNEGFISFDGDKDKVCGGRCKHLNGTIKISERKEDGSVETYWDKIYIK